MSLNYSYDKPRKYCEQMGTVCDERFIPTVDKSFTELNLTQDQVDGAMRVHIWVVINIFSPNQYSWKQRIGLAWHFLFGKSFV